MTTLPMMREGAGWRPDHCRREARCIGEVAREGWTAAHCPTGCVQYEAVTWEAVAAVHALPRVSMLGLADGEVDEVPEHGPSVVTIAAVIEALRNAGRPIATTVVADATRRSYTLAAKALQVLAAAGRVRIAGSHKPRKGRPSTLWELTPQQVAA